MAKSTKEVMQELVDRRKELGLRQVDVAEAMGIGQPSVSELERGEVSPKLETLQRYADAVNAQLEVEVVKNSERDEG